MSIKTTTMGAAALLAAAVFASPAFADGLPGRGRVADAPMPRTCTTAGNVGFTTDYVFRGISQSNENAAVQGGVDLTCGNFYAGVWGSSVDLGFDSSAEIDIYGGYKMKLHRFDLDFGFIYYGYPGSQGNADLDYFELKAAASTEVWKGGTLGGVVFYSPDYTGGTGPVTTLEGTLSQALPKVAIFSPTLSATVGRSFFSDDDAAGNDPSYTYWNVGLTLGFLEKWSLDLRYWDTDGEGLAAANGPLADERFLATIKYTF
jgi:uncharacterized protein (TIGR02001 family)